MDTFQKLNAVDVSAKVEKKNNLSYLSWAWAWGELKKVVPTANYTIYENKDGWNYHHDGKTAWVKVGVKVEELEHIEQLPVMDFKNKSIPIDLITSFDVNKTIQRALTKAIARHGLGLYIYAGEDLPEAEIHKPQTEAKPAPAPAKSDSGQAPAAPEQKRVIGKITESADGSNGFVHYTIKGIELATKKADIMLVMDKAEKEGAEVSCVYSEVVKGKYTNRYILTAEVAEALPF